MEQVFLFTVCRISMVYLLAILYSFCERRYRRLHTVAILVLCYVLTWPGDYIHYFTVCGKALFIPITVYQVILVQGTALLIDQYRDFRSLFTGLTAPVYVLIANVIAMYSFAITSNYALSVGIQITIHSILLLLMCIFMKDFYQEQQSTMNRGWGPICIIPVLFYLIVTALASWPQNLLENPKSITGVLLVLLFIPVSYFLIIRLLKMYCEDARLQQNNDFLESLASRLKHETELMADNELKTAVLRHDIRHQATLIASYLDAGAYDQIRELLSEVNHTLEDLKPKNYCDNVAVNGVITSCNELAIKNQVRMQINVMLPRSLEINEYEFVTVVSNLLENAVQAAAKVRDKNNREVNLNLSVYKEQIVLDIENTFEQPCTIDETTGLPRSENGAGHGYGLRSVVTFADKYNAAFDYSIEDDRFIVRLLV